MTTSDKDKESKTLPAAVGRKASRRLKARSEGDQGVWFGLGLFGMVGWTIAITTLIGVAIGIWMDRTWPSTYSWTLTMLFIGLIIGCMNAWYWVNKESRHDEADLDDEGSNKPR